MIVNNTEYGQVYHAHFVDEYNSLLCLKSSDSGGHCTFLQVIDRDA
jgi:hypothetical protein